MSGSFLKNFHSLPKEKKDRLLRRVFNPKIFREITRAGGKKDETCEKKAAPVLCCTVCGNEQHDVAQWRKVQTSEEKWDNFLQSWYHKQKCQRKLQKSCEKPVFKKSETFSKLESLQSFSQEIQQRLNKSSIGQTSGNSLFDQLEEMKAVSQETQKRLDTSLGSNESFLSSTMIQDVNDETILREASALGDSQFHKRYYLSTVIEEEDSGSSLKRTTAVEDFNVFENIEGQEEAGVENEEDSDVFQNTENQDEARNENEEEQVLSTPDTLILSPRNEMTRYTSILAPSLEAENDHEMEAPLIDEPNDEDENEGPHMMIPEANGEGPNRAIEVCTLTDEANTCPDSPGCSESRANASTPEQDEREEANSRISRRMSLSMRSGVCFPIRRILRGLKKATLMKRVWLKGAIYLAAVLQYVSSEVLDLAASFTKEQRRKIIKPKDINVAMQYDQELRKLTKEAILPGVTRSFK